MREANAHPAVHHAFLRRFADGSYPTPAAAMRRYAIEYSGYAAWFPRYLEAVISRLPEAAHRSLLLRNLEEEKGQLDADDQQSLREVGIDPATVVGVPHPQLFRRFCAAIDVGADQLAQATPAAAAWRTRFLDFLQDATAAEAVGALGLGTEHVVKPIYQQLLRGIRSVGTLQREQYVFFELHCLVDDQHQQDLMEIAAELAATPTGLAGLRRGMRTALALRCSFWDHLDRAVGGASLAHPA
ncbi:MAG: iron-containing redox enzyme family protein [Planctomycetes bacterium]|nr:iron-containing redox enzyme family protein [Planctomycetota bacterium]